MTRFERLLDTVNPATLSGAVFYAVLVALLGLVGTWVIRSAARRALHHDTVDRTAVMFLRPLGQMALWVILLVTYAHVIPGLRALGTALLAGASVVSIVLGVAAQSTLGNLVSGVALLVYRPFRVGDRLQVMAPTGVETGTVESVTLGYTVLQTYDNRRVVLPNSLVSSQVTINLTTVDPRVMAAVAIGVSYTADIKRAREILLEIAGRHANVVEVVGCPVIQLANSSVTLSLRAWCHDIGAAKGFEYDLYESAKARFDEAGIEIPYPYQNVVLSHAPQDQTG